MTIEKYQTNDGSAKAQPSSLRPHLGISAKSDANQQASADRILSNLSSEPNTKHPKTRLANRPSIKYLPLLGVALVAAAFGYQYLSGETNKPASGAPDRRLATATPAVLAAALSVESPPAMGASKAPEAAQIINAPLPAVASLTASATAPDTLAKTIEPGVAPPAATLEKALTAKAPSTAQPESKQHKKSATSKSVPSTSATAAVSPAKVPHAKPTVAATATDQDVNLLAALIAHSEAAPAPAPQPSLTGAAKPVTTPKSTKTLKKENLAAKERAAAEKVKSKNKNDA